MCKNIGFGSMSTNSKIEFELFDLSFKKIEVKKIDLRESVLGYKELTKYYSKIVKKFKIKYYKFRITNKIKNILGLK